MTAKVDPTYHTDHHFNSVARVRHYIGKCTGMDLNTMAEFQILLGLILGIFSTIN